MFSVKHKVYDHKREFERLNTDTQNVLHVEIKAKLNMCLDFLIVVCML